MDRFKNTIYTWVYALKSKRMTKKMMFSVLGVVAVLLLILITSFIKSGEMASLEQENKELLEIIDQLESDLIDKEDEVERANLERESALLSIGFDVNGEEVELSEKDDEINRLLGVQQELENYIIEIENELKAIKLNFELYKKELTNSDSDN